MITKVRESTGHISNFNKEKITASLLAESELLEILGKGKKITIKDANKIADDVEKIIDEHNVKYLSSPLIREIACATMIKNNLEEIRSVYTRVGLPIFDLFKIITNPEMENANLVNNAETAHKYVADKVLKESAIMLLPHHISEAHLSGDLHIHDLEYLMTRTFCMDWDLRNFFYYGLDSSGINKTNVAGPAKNAEVAILHAAKVLGSAQTNYSVDASEDIVISNNEIMTIKKIGGFVDFLMKENTTTEIPEINGEYLDISDLNINTIAFNPVTYMTEFKPINRIIRHICKDELFEIKTKSGRNVKTTGSHSVFKFKNAMPCEAKVSDLKIGDELVIPSFLPSSSEIKELDLIKLLSKLEASQINDIFVVGSGFKCTGSDKHFYDWNRRDSIPLSHIVKNSIDINSKTCFLRTSRSNKKIPAFIKLTPEFYRLLGYFTSEGHITESDIGIHHLVFSFGIEKKMACADDTKQILKTIFNVDSKSCNPHESVIQIIVDSKLLCILFKHIFNSGVNAHSKRIPKYVFDSSEGNKKEFLTGYYCDGYSKKRHISFSTVSKGLSSDVSYLLLQLGIISRTEEGISPERIISEGRLIKESKYYKIYIYGRKNLESFSSILGTRNNLDEYKTDEISHLRENKISIGNLCSDTIISILKVKSSSEYVYDLSINGYENFVGGFGGIILHNSGGQGFYNFLTFISPYLKDRSEKDIRQLMQMFLYEISQTMVARGGQVVFSSIQLTPGVPTLWKDKPSVYAGEVHHDQPYGMFEKEVRIAFKVLMELMMEGDYNGRPFNFPKPEIGFMKEFLISPQDDEYYNTDTPTYDNLYDFVFKLTAKFGTPYFDNMIPAYRNHDEDTIACYQCCAYNFSTNQQTDNEFNNKLYFKNYIGFSMGAWQVVTINCPRIAYKSITSGDYIKNWKELVNLAVDVFKEKKKYMDIQLASNRIPFAQQKPKNHHRQSEHSLVDFDKLVWEIGLIGIDDVVRYYTGKSMHESVDSFELAQYLCLEMKACVEQKAKETGMQLVLARTPAETTAQRFAVSDIINPLYADSALKIVSGDVVKAQSLVSKTKNLPIYYTNGTHVPVSAPCSLIERIRIEEDFFDILDGGNIHHIFLAERYPDYKGLKEFAMGVIKSTKIGYFSFTKILTVCNDCYHIEQGQLETCANCASSNIDYISRITGYQSNVKSWTEGKKQEFKDRKLYKMR